MTQQSYRSFVDKYPDYELAVRRLILRDRDFCAACENHEACIAAMRHWEASGNEERAAEYLHLSRELEEEILGFLQRAASEAGPTPSAPRGNAREDR